MTKTRELEEQAQFAEWMAASCDGCELAFAALHRATQVRVRRTISRWNPDAAQVDEVLNDTFLQAWRTAASYSCARGSVLAWLRTIARCRAIDSARAATRRQAIFVQVDDWDTLIAAAEPRPEAGWTRACESALAPLCAVQRQVLLLSFAHGRTHQEIAAHFDMPVGTVKSHARRALAVLNERLGAA